LSLQNELASVASFVKTVLPAATQIKYEVPTQPTKDNVVVRALTSDFASETGYHYRVERTFQIVAYGADSPSTLDKMDAIARKVNDGKTMIPMKDSLRYIRCGSFSFGAPFKTESGVYACIGVLHTEVREARTQEQYEKIMHVYPRYEIRIPIE